PADRPAACRAARSSRAAAALRPARHATRRAARRSPTPDASCNLRFLADFHVPAGLLYEPVAERLDLRLLQGALGIDDEVAGVGLDGEVDRLDEAPVAQIVAGIDDIAHGD